MSLEWIHAPNGQPGLPPFPVWPVPHGGYPITVKEVGPKPADPSHSKLK